MQAGEETWGRATPRLRAAGLFVIVSSGVALLPATGYAPNGAGLLLLVLASAGMFLQVVARVDARARPRMLALSVLMLLQLGVWIGCARIGGIALAVADARAVAPGVELSQAHLELLVAAPLIVLAPIAAGLWLVLGRQRLEPSFAAKFALGYVCVGLSCACVAAGIEWSAGEGGASLGAIGACLALLTIAALSVGPACVAAILELAPSGQRTACMASWSLLYVFARSLGSWAQAPTLSSAAAFDGSLALGFGAVATAVLSSFMWRGLEALGRAPEPAAELRLSTAKRVDLVELEGHYRGFGP